MNTLNIKRAQAAVDAAVKRAEALGVPVNVTVIDAATHLKAFTRMDGAVLGSIDISSRKARTAALFECNSERVWEYCKPGAPAPGLELSNGGLAPSAGGIPLRSNDGVMVGAIGVSGGSTEQDFEIASAGVVAFAD